MCARGTLVCVRARSARIVSYVRASFSVRFSQKKNYCVRLRLGGGLRVGIADGLLCGFSVLKRGTTHQDRGTPCGWRGVLVHNGAFP